MITYDSIAMTSRVTLVMATDKQKFPSPYTSSVRWIQHVIYFFSQNTYIFTNIQLYSLCHNMPIIAKKSGLSLQPWLQFNVVPKTGLYVDI